MCPVQCSHCLFQMVGWSMFALGCVFNHYGERFVDSVKGGRR